MIGTDWHSQDLADLCAEFNVELDAGLSRDCAAAGFESHGPNRLIQSARQSLIRRLFDQISDVTVIALLAAAAIATLMGLLEENPDASFLRKYGDACAILGIVVLNALLGLLQENRADEALSALARVNAPRARVLRNGILETISAEYLVPGDCIEICAGSIVPADARLYTSDDLWVDESALTGESAPVEKSEQITLAAEAVLAERSNMIFSGTSVHNGSARALVVATGMRSQIGGIAQLLASVKNEPTPLQRTLNRFGHQIVLACVAISGVVGLVGFLRGIGTLREHFLTSVSLAVAAIPEGLPAITTIVLALGTQRMAKRNALVRRLVAVEGLGSVQVICTDKTGTLTENKMTVRKACTANLTLSVCPDSKRSEAAFVVSETHSPGLMNRPMKYRDNPDVDALIMHAAFAPGPMNSESNTRNESVFVPGAGNPTNTALRIFSRNGGFIPESGVSFDKEAPFSSATKLGAVSLNVDETSCLILVRGAPEVLLDRSAFTIEDGSVRALTDATRSRFLRFAHDWGQDALRVVGLAQKSSPIAAKSASARNLIEVEDLTFLGLVGIMDPPRREVGEALKEARGAGIRTMMITGDQLTTAQAIGINVGLIDVNDGELAECTLSGPALDELSSSELAARVGSLRIVARATPKHKLQIIEALKAQGSICAMTGDGVNDAPAVKAASIGVAMGRTGTDVTKDAADIVLADDNYATIVQAIEEGRAIFANIRRFIYFLLSSNAGIVMVVFVAGLCGLQSPLAPIQILWINLVTNGLPALALGVEPREPGLMSSAPRDPNRTILETGDWIRIVGFGALMAAIALVVFVVLLEQSTYAVAQTSTFAILALSPLFHSFNCRSAIYSNFKIGWSGNRPLWGAAATGFVLVFIVVYLPSLRAVFRTAYLPLSLLSVIVGVSTIPLLVGEIGKVLRAATDSFRRSDL